MHSLQKQFHDFISNKDLLTEEDCTLVAVSGGLDSMVLADLFLKANLSFAVAHCNFDLRGDESDGDEVLVKRWCEGNGVSLHRKRFELGKGSIQLNARNARYEWFDALCDENKYQKLATAHHLNDSLETTLINLSRGTGIKGIAGIKPRSETTIRPLLFARKSQLEAYAKETSLEWREDSSNSKSDYDRNIIRLHVIPKLEELNPSLTSTFSATSERLALAAQVVSEKVKAIKKQFLSKSGKHLELDVSWTEGNSDLLILSEILSEFGFNYTTCKEVYGALGKPGKVFSSTGFELSIDRKSIFITPVSDASSEGLIIDGYGDFKQERGVLSVKSIEKNAVNFEGPSSTSYLDEDKITFPLTLRSWRQGDKFQPLGMKGSKKVSDYLIDMKVPLAIKNDVLVLLSGDEIVWLVDYQISDKFKISSETESVLRLSLNRLSAFGS